MSITSTAPSTSRILVVDDEPFNRDLLLQQLEAYATTVAASGEEALRMIAADPPDLVLLDVMMPGVDGFEVCRTLKEEDNTRFIPVVIMTALDGGDDRIRGIEAGADDFLTKPVDERQLLARIRTALRAKHSLDRKLDVAGVASPAVGPSTPAEPPPTPEVPTAVRACARCGAVYSIDVPTCALDGERLSMLERDPLIGRRLDRYEILERAGSGGMGCVYLAAHATLKRQRYAVKVPYGELALERTHAARFFREAEACAALAHPNVVSVLDFGTTPDGLPYMVMEYVNGQTLKDILRDRGRLPFERAARIARQMALGLAHAHERGIVHRDVKPANVIVTEHDGEEIAKLLDFGVVGFLASHDDERLTDAFVRMGTPLYMAPEQMDSRRIDPQVDLYALGVTLYEMIAGQAPFRTCGLGLIADKLTATPVPVPLTGGLEALASALIAPRPEDRPVSARAVVEAIDAIIAERRESALVCTERAPVVVDGDACTVRLPVPVPARVRYTATLRSPTAEPEPTIAPEPRPKRAVQAPVSQARAVALVFALGVLVATTAYVWSASC